MYTVKNIFLLLAGFILAGMFGTSCKKDVALAYGKLIVNNATSIIVNIPISDSPDPVI